LENEEIMKYYVALGDDKGTLIPRYFMSNDATLKKKALGEIHEIMGSLVCPKLPQISPDVTDNI